MAFVILTFAFSTAAIAQNTSGNNTGGSANLCQGVTCSESSVTCADGYVAKCSNSCDSATGSCSQCAPSCSGHDKTFCETTQCGGNEKTCPDGFKASCTKTCDNAAKQCKDCEPSCAGHDAVTQPANGTTTTCPAAPTPLACEQGKYLETKYDDKKCITGYECKQSTSTTCPAAPSKPACGQDEYAETKYDANKCITGYQCKAKITCPQLSPPSPDFCKDGYTEAKKDSSGCITGYECRKTETRTCPTPPPFPQCNGRVETRHDNNGCAIGYECRPESSSNDARGAKWQCYDSSTYGESGECRPAEKWKQMAEESCRDKCNADKSKCGVNSFSLGERCGPGANCGNNFCEGGEERSCPHDCQVTTGPGKCGDTICDAGEDANRCPSDCKVPGRTCPLAIQCSDGTQTVCKQDGNSCQCGQCPIDNLPQGCRQEKDEKGFVTVQCEQREQCKEVSQEDRVACTEKGGVPRFSRDGSGCKRFECSFGGGGENIFAPGHSQQCPTREEWEMTSKKCASLGKITVTKIERGCNIPTCIEKRGEQCGLVPGPERERIEQECSERGARTVRFTDERGCQKISCADENTCQKDLPEEAYRACGAKGGEIAVKRDQNGCMIFSDCLRKGNMQESYVEEQKGELDTAELLGIAIKLERLRVELDKLSRETKNIAEYYKNTGSNEAERFERVSGMFAAATDKIDDIKNKIRDSAESLDKDDMREIRQDIKYVKDVMIKDILYMMLSNGDDVKKIKERSSTDCENDEQCFGEALRLCKPMKFYPEGDDGPEVTITGLEDGKCIMKARLDDDKGPPAGVVAGGPPWEMTCRIEKYALGMRNPEEDIFPYCQGSMVELIKKYGTGGSGGAPGIPGKCSGEGCKEYCGKGPAEAKECLEQMGQYLPEEAKQGLQMIAEGKGSGGFGGQGEFSDSDQYRRDQFSEEFGNDDYNAGFRHEEGTGPEFPSGQQSRQPSIRPSQPVQIQPREFRQPQENQQQAACVGCLNNGVCDPNECSGCADCLRK